MSFHEELEKDIENTFFNFDEFATKHKIGDSKAGLQKEISIVMSDDLNVVHSGGQKFIYPALSADSPTFYAKKKDFEKLPRYGDNFWLDSKLYKVESVTDDMGVLRIKLSTFSTGVVR